MGTILKRLSLLFVAAITAVIDSFFPFGSFIVKGLQKVFGSDFAGREGDLFSIATNVLSWIVDKFFSIFTSESSSYMAAWDQFISMIRAWDLLFPIHEVFFLILLLLSYFLIKYTVLFCLWCVRRIADIIP